MVDQPRRVDRTPDHTPSRPLAYEPHTGRELELMLRGRKPLTVFTETIQGDCDQDGYGEDFDQHARSGTFVYRQDVETWDDAPAVDRSTVRGRRTRLYALPDEAWRIPAYLLLQRVSTRGPWNDALERLQGALLGYTEAETEAGLRGHYERHAGWGCFTLHAATTDLVVDAIAELGHKAFPPDFLAEATVLSAGSTPNLIKQGVDALSAPGRSRLLRFGVAKGYFERLKRSEARYISIYDASAAGGVRELNRALLTSVEIIA